MNEKLKIDYENYLKYELNYSEYTIKEYFFHLDKYFQFLKNKKINYLSVNKDNVIEFLKYLDEKKLTNATIGNILSSLRNFYNYLLDNKMITNNVFKLIKNPKLEKKLPNFLSDEEIRVIFDSLKLETELDYRNKLIIELLYSTGVRVSELVNIKINDISFSENTIRIFGKGKKERIVFFGSYAQSAINDYLSIRTIDSEYLIINNKGMQITTRSIQKIINKIIDSSAVKNKVSPHTFRHTFATHLLNSGASIRSVQELLGHSSLNTTERYTHITPEYLREEYLKNMPRK